jgi:HEAT repeat protein
VWSDDDPLKKLLNEAAWENLTRPAQVDSEAGLRAALSAEVVPLLRHDDPRVRSRAAVLLGRRLRSAHWAERYLVDRDARVRANVVESLWGLDLPGARQILSAATRDRANRVAGNALYGFYLLEPDEAEPAIRDMAAHADPSRRTTAAWIMGQTGDLRFKDELLRLSRDPQPAVRKVALRALLRVSSQKGPAHERVAI